MRVKWSGAIQISAVYIGTVVGAGFATGREIYEFFTKYGFIGLLSILTAGILFIFTGTKLMTMALKSGVRSYEEFNIFIFGKKAGHILNILFFFMLLGVTSVMFSGAGAVFEEQLGMPKAAGVLITMALALAVLLGGIKGLFAVNVFVVPIMIFFSIMMCLMSLKGGEAAAVIFNSPPLTNWWEPAISPFLYTAFNLALSQAVLVPVASDIGDEKTIKAGAILGGVFLTLILITSHLSLISLPQIGMYEIPTAEIMKRFAEHFYWIYIFVLYGEIFTSVIGNMFGLERQLKSYLKLRPLLIFLLLFLSAYILSLIDYGSLLSYLYPLFGKISLAFLVLLWIREKKIMKKTFR
ncbi:YkvI family membrane protein [Peribacillus kribbensis]|uniref:YkvI family membrane protein n=1 Tax=Peribacillus kribbensis TaxID=356658 RepID=UPI00040F68DE|nr:membrane protein [Peribacillus kribbensis]